MKTFCFWICQWKSSKSSKECQVFCPASFPASLPTRPLLRGLLSDHRSGFQLCLASGWPLITAMAFFSSASFPERWIFCQSHAGQYFPLEHSSEAFLQDSELWLPTCVFLIIVLHGQTQSACRRKIGPAFAPKPSTINILLFYCRLFDALWCHTFWHLAAEMPSFHLGRALPGGWLKTQKEQEMETRSGARWWKRATRHQREERSRPSPLWRNLCMKCGSFWVASKNKPNFWSSGTPPPFLWFCCCTYLIMKHTWEEETEQTFSSKVYKSGGRI